MAKHIKECWLLKDNDLWHGYKDKYGFYSDHGLLQGTGGQKLRKKIRMCFILHHLNGQNPCQSVRWFIQETVQSYVR